MGCKKLNTDFFNFLEVIHPKKRVSDKKKRVSALQYVYQYKDHLGNIRLSYQDKNNDGVITASTEIVEENNYYPFGLKHKGYNSNVNGVVDKYHTYNGKEWNESLGLNIYEMDVRSYDPALARFTSIDPVTHFDYSTYSTFNNNPIFWADPSGADSTTDMWGRAKFDSFTGTYIPPNERGSKNNPVFGSDGKPRGTTKNCYKGMPIIYDGDKDFSKLSAEELKKLGGKILSEFQFKVPSIRDAIENLIVNKKLNDGLNIEGTITIINSTDNITGLYNADWATPDNLLIRRKVDKNGNSFADNFFEPTVENLRNLVNKHEIMHSKGLGGSDLEHITIYKSQIDSPQFNHTTRRFKQYISFWYYWSGGNLNGKYLKLTRCAL